ncbi:single-stranded DNA-binding protein [Promicromonospora sp. NPDC050880]|uniref:single-stranded DNA-binding protein n=1 Tax=Promicromonospora sp. NPDC050880 TaxID=3364406 RepID=UPI00378D5B56
MKDVMVTVSGFVGNNPALHVNPVKEREWTSFRVASTRRYVNEDGDWTDGKTLWFTVKAWRAAAASVARSVHKGDPVVVTGRLEVDEWTGPEGQERMSLVIVASAIGLDATRGKVEFTREVHHVPAGEADPFAVQAPAPAGGGVPDDARELEGEGGAPAPGSGATASADGEGQRELVNA